MFKKAIKITAAIFIVIMVLAFTPASVTATGNIRVDVSEILGMSAQEIPPAVEDISDEDNYENDEPPTPTATGHNDTELPLSARISRAVLTVVALVGVFLCAEMTSGRMARRRQRREQQDEA